MPIVKQDAHRRRKARMPRITLRSEPAAAAGMKAFAKGVIPFDSEGGMPTERTFPLLAGPESDAMLMFQPCDNAQALDSHGFMRIAHPLWLLVQGLEAKYHRKIGLIPTLARAPNVSQGFPKGCSYSRKDSQASKGCYILLLFRKLKYPFVFFELAPRTGTRESLGNDRTLAALGLKVATTLAEPLGTLGVRELARLDLARTGLLIGFAGERIRAVVVFTRDPEQRTAGAVEQ